MSDLKEIQAAGEQMAQHWYLRHKAALIGRILQPVKKNRVLDWGAGSGFFSRYVAQRPGVESVIAVDPGYSRDWQEQVGPVTVHFFRQMPESRGDLLLLMDVLEHVPDDLGLLQQAASHVIPGGHLLLTVPAFSWLWSGHDEFLGHYRRYTLPQLRRLVDRAGLSWLEGSYGFVPVLPLVMVWRAFTRLRDRIQSRPPTSNFGRHPLWLHGLLRAGCALELPWFRYNRLAGVSAWALIRTS